MVLGTPFFSLFLRAYYYCYVAFAIEFFAIYSLCCGCVCVDDELYASSECIGVCVYKLSLE